MFVLVPIFNSWELLLALIIVNVLLVAATEWDKPGWATICLAAAFGYFAYMHVFNVWTFASTHPWRLAALVLGYYAVGLLWGLWRWYEVLREVERRYTLCRAKFLQTKGIRGDDIPETLRYAWNNEVRQHAVDQPKAAEHRSRIVVWMAYWPWSLLWRVLDDGIFAVFGHLYNLCSGAFDGLANRVYQKHNRDQGPLADPAPAPRTQS